MEVVELVVESDYDSVLPRRGIPNVAGHYSPIAPGDRSEGEEM